MRRLARAFVDANVCGGHCTVGATECQGDGLVTCVADKTGCGVWGAAVACGANHICAGADGSASCRPVDIRVPRPMAPLSTATTTSQRPRFHWLLTGQDDGAVVDVCVDRACTDVLTTLTAKTGPASVWDFGVSIASRGTQRLRRRR